MQSYKTIDEFIATLTGERQEIAKKIRATILKIIPNAEETISYGIPTFKLKGKNIVHFCVYKNHAGFYPGTKAIDDFKSELAIYKTSKGTVQFPLDKPIPYKLIAQITSSCYSHVL